MNISDHGIDFIKQWEAFREDWYKCSANVWTIGYGHTEESRDGQITSSDLPGDMSAPITEDEAEQLLQDDLRWFVERVNSLVEVDLTQNQFDALVSLAFNIGTGDNGFGGSTLLGRLNQGDYEAAAEQFVREEVDGTEHGWIYADGQKVDGLIRRRWAERKLFEQLDYSHIEPQPLDPMPVQQMRIFEDDASYRYPLRKVAA